MAFFRRTIQPKGRDRFVVNLGTQEREVLAAVCTDVVGAIDDDPEAALLRRLFPVAHATDETVEADYRRMVGDDLLRSRREVLERVAATANDRELDRDTLEAWMVGCNSVRLVLGTRLDVSEDLPRDLDPDDPELPAWAVYEFLGMLVSVIVDALGDTLDA